jgi:hypothetical protein
VRLLAGFSKFVIADLSSPKSVPSELGTKTQSYLSVDQLIETMDDEIIKPAEAKSKRLLARLNPAEP